MTEIEEQNGKVTKANILTSFKVPVARGQGRLDKSITVNISTNHIVLTKAMIFELGMPKGLAFSFTDDKVFVIPDCTLKGVREYAIRKVNSIAQLHTNINNKDLCTDLALTFGMLEGKFDLTTTYYMEINNNKVFEVHIPEKPTV